MEKENLKEKIDFYYDEKGRMVFTADYLMRRGYCCESGCRHCPYGFKDCHSSEGWNPTDSGGSPPSRG